MQQIRHQVEYNADVATAFETITDPAYQQEQLAASGATDVRIEQNTGGGQAGTLHQTIQQTVTVDVPGFAKKVLPSTNVVTQTEDWAAAGPDGSRTGTVRVSSKGLPADISGTMTLAPSGAGCTHSIDLHVKVSIPLIGGKLEKFIAESAGRDTEQRCRFNQERLRG